MDNILQVPDNVGVARGGRSSFHVGIPRPVLRRAEVCAAFEDRALADVVTAALVNYLNNHIIQEGSGNIILK